MNLLRITQSAEGQDKYRVEVSLEAEGAPRRTAVSSFDFKLTPQDQEDIRWYLEDFLQYPLDPAPAIAANIEERMEEIGATLFEAVFNADDDARDLWAALRADLSDTRIEVITGVREATAIPWELIRDPKTDTALALRALAFVRAQPQTAERPRLPATGSGPIRILLVLCRPGGSEDVPFRSVAGKLIKGLSEKEREAFQLEVLRPPTFEQLGKTLRRAQQEGRPYHIVHFDGHGTYEDLNKEGFLGKLKKGLNPLLLSVARSGKHGYLLFENPGAKENLQLVDGPTLGKLLVETGVPVLVLNACRSAHAEPPPEPEQAKGDVHTQVRAMGSLAQEAMDAGIAGVVAMSHVVYVVTAAQFVADMYASLVSGLTLGGAVSNGRKQLAAKPLREIGFDPRPLQDWSVPIVYEAAPLSLFPRAEGERKLKISMEEAAEPERGDLDPRLPPRPDVGFFGRDETLLALDRAFDTQKIVLLHAFAGAGKTAAAAEFARWYALTGGVDGPVMFTSFEYYKPLARVLDQVGTLFGPALEATGVNWPALEDEQRREVALQALAQVPVLWIWDNVEPVAGFPAGTESAWSIEEQDELLDFLRDARETRARFLLTSRRDEQAWLKDLPARISVPPMPFQERVELARALADKRGRRITEVEDWRPLLRYTRGNPLTVTVLVGQALREGIYTRDGIERFVEDLRAGEAAVEDDEAEGRSKSLGASLSYGFGQTFNEKERKVLALLYLFQGFVNVNVLRAMGDPDKDWGLAEIQGLSREDGIKLLDRASEAGLLTARGVGLYSIHPALPWYFKDLFDTFYPDRAKTPDEQPPVKKATRAFVTVMGGLGSYYHDQYGDGNRGVISLLTAEEDNLLHARRLARRNGWWDGIISAMQGLDVLYDYTGRRAEWKRLVHEIVPEFVDPETDGPLPRQEKEWSIVTEYRVRLAREARKYEEAERLQIMRVEWDRKLAAPALALLPKNLDGSQKNDVRSLATSLHELGEIQREEGRKECVESYKEAFDLVKRIGDRAGTAICAFNLGRAYRKVSEILDLSEAEDWYKKSLKMHSIGDDLGKAKCFGALGDVAYMRFLEAKDAGRPEDELSAHLNQALSYCSQKLDLCPKDAIEELATTHHQFGYIHGDFGDIDRALRHFHESIRYKEIIGDIYGAAESRFNISLSLARSGRFSDALKYAKAALRNFETFGDRAASEIQMTRGLIADIESAMKSEE
jgi:tetratricopeptide (TPR) repeat protein